MPDRYYPLLLLLLLLMSQLLMLSLLLLLLLSLKLDLYFVDFQLNIEQVNFAYYSQAKRETCSAQNLTKQLQQRSESS